MQSELCEARIGNKALKVYRRITRTYPVPHCGKCNLATGWIHLLRSQIESVRLAHNRGNVRAWTSSEVMSICMEDVSGLRTASADYYSNHDPPGGR